MRRVGIFALACGIAAAFHAGCGSSGTSNNGQATTGPDGGGSSSSGSSSGTGDAATGDDGGSDAEPPDDGPWPAAHYPLPQFAQQGGRVIASPKLVTVTFAGNADRDALRTFGDQFVADTSWWQAVSAGYGVGAPTSGGYVELPDTVSNTTIDDSTQLKPMLQQLITAGTLPAPDLNTIYLLYFPASTTINLTGYGVSCQAYAAYHDSVAVSQDGGGYQVAYAVIPNCPQAPATDQSMGEYTGDVSHEVIEASTDPEPQVAPGWYGYNNAWFHMPGSVIGQGEVADVCHGSVTDANNNLLVRAWSNGAAAASHDPCQPEPAGEIYYALAVPTQPLGGLGDGYVVAKRGTTQTLDAVFFSEAKLPSDAQLSLGLRQHGQLNPSIGTGITATMSQTTAHNGVHVAITITVDTSAAVNDYNVIARSQLSSTDRHDWPFVLHVP
jgi:hypothetical protein